MSKLQIKGRKHFGIGKNLKRANQPRTKITRNAIIRKATHQTDAI